MPADINRGGGAAPAQAGGRDRRTIRSYVLRQGRLTTGQAKALERYWPEYGVDSSPVELDLDRLFGRVAPRVLDIGTGMGETLVELARLNPGNDYLAVEVHRPGVGNLLRLAAGRGLTNIRVIRHDVMDVLKHQLGQQCLDEVYLFFPDPWPKKRHHKRRLVQPAFLDLLKARLKQHARLFLASDWEDMARHMLEICDADSGLANLAGPGHFSPRPAWRPVTKFENRGRGLDLKAWDLCYCLSGSRETIRSR